MGLATSRLLTQYAQGVHRMHSSRRWAPPSVWRTYTGRCVVAPWHCTKIDCTRREEQQVIIRSFIMLLHGRLECGAQARARHAGVGARAARAQAQAVQEPHNDD